jgi:hypothetical protein
MSETNTLTPDTLTLSTLTQSDPPPKGSMRKPSWGMVSAFKKALVHDPGVWYEFPTISKSGIGQANGGGYEFTTRAQYDEDGKRLGVKVWGRYVGE